MASREVRRLVYGRLPLWGSIQRDGPLASPHSNHGGSFGPRLCVPTWCTDLTCAFAALNPQTTGLADLGRTAWLVHAPFTIQQHVIWLYYDPRFAPDSPDTSRADRQQWQHERDRERQKAVKAHDSARDALVGRALHIASWKARRLRSEAVYFIADFVKWDEEVAA